MHYLKKKDLSRLIPVIYRENSTHHLIALTMFRTGARISQVLAIRGTDVFELDGRMVIRIPAAKGGEVGYKALIADPRPEFDMTPLVALAAMRGTHLLLGTKHYRYFNECLGDYTELAGIHEDYAHSHVLRHSAAMVIWDETHRPGAITKFLQHLSPSSAMAYLQEADGVMAQEAMNNFKFEEVA